MTNIPFTSDEDVETDRYLQMMQSGFIATNTLIQTLILQKETSDNTLFVDNTIGPIYQREAEEDPTFSTLGQIF